MSIVRLVGSTTWQAIAPEERPDFAAVAVWGGIRQEDRLCAAVGEDGKVSVLLGSTEGVSAFLEPFREDDRRTIEEVARENGGAVSLVVVDATISTGDFGEGCPDSGFCVAEVECRVDDAEGEGSSGLVMYSKFGRIVR